jgi:hypothetical protein
MKIILNIAITVMTIVLILGVCWFFMGSLEMYPTAEEIEKARIAALTIAGIALAADCILIWLRVKAGNSANN